MSTVTQLTADEKQLLKLIIDATNDNSFVYTSPEQHQNLLDQDLVEVNSELTNPSSPSQIATRATIQGVNFMNAEASVLDNPTTFEIDSEVPLTKSARSPKGLKYPIDLLEIGQSFHVAPDDGEDVDTLARRMAAQVSAANNRFKAVKQPVEYETVKKKVDGVEQDVQREVKISIRRFTARRVNETDPRGAGIRVFRVSP